MEKSYIAQVANITPGKSESKTRMKGLQVRLGTHILDQDWIGGKSTGLELKQNDIRDVYSIANILIFLLAP